MDKHIESIGGLCSLVHRQSGIHFTKALKNQPIGVGQVFLLLGILKSPGQTQEEYAQRFVLDKGTVAKAMKKLEENGLIKQEINEKNRRQKLIYPLDKAKKLANEFFTSVMEWENILTSRITDEEKEQLINILLKVADIKKSDCC